MYKGKLIWFDMCFSEFESLIGKENTDWEGSIPDYVLKIIKEKLNISEKYALNYLENDFNMDTQQYEDDISIGFTLINKKKITL